MELDLGMIRWLGERQTPIHIVLSKADKLTNQEKIETLRGVKRTVEPMVQQGHPISAQLWSALKKTGLEELETQLKTWIGHTPASATTTAADDPQA
jgi:GTP-binding protein